jgi:hypothetical protein
MACCGFKTIPHVASLRESVHLDAIHILPHSHTRVHLLNGSGSQPEKKEATKCLNRFARGDSSEGAIY